MSNLALHRHSVFLILIFTTATSLIILPSSYDTINTPKLLFLGVFGITALVLLITQRKYYEFRKNRLALILSCFLSLNLVLIAVKSGNFFDQLYGDFGRNTGLLALLSFISIFVFTLTVSGSVLLEKLNRLLLGVGVVAVTYGLLQIFRIDPVDWQVLGYTPVYGFFGNPNFQSAFLGITSSIVWAQLFRKEITVVYRVFLLTFLLLALFVIVKSNADQGLIVFFLGLAVVITLKIYSLRSRVSMIAWSIFVLGSSFISIMGMLKIGPLANLLYKDSLTYRGDYWRAAVNIALAHPITGVGLDNYGDNYRLYRTIDATLRRSADVTSNSPHNVFLDYLVNGGFPTFVLYSTLIIFTLVTIFRFLKKNSVFSPAYAGLTAAFITYLAQSVISVNHIGLAVWGWVLMGAILGFGNDNRPELFNEVSKRDIKKISKVKSTELQTSVVIATFVGILLGFAISFPPLKANLDYFSALKTKQADVLIQEVLQNPLDVNRIVRTAALLKDNNLDEESLKLILKATVVSPNTFEAWQVLYFLENASISQKSNALSQMRRLDPHNPNLK
jgi:O-antigen ligase